jgi:hypothetical protein
MERTHGKLMGRRRLRKRSGGAAATQTTEAGGCPISRFWTFLVHRAVCAGWESRVLLLEVSFHPCDDAFGC